MKSAGNASTPLTPSIALIYLDGERDELGQGGGFMPDQLVLLDPTAH